MTLERMAEPPWLSVAGVEYGDISSVIIAARRYSCSAPRCRSQNHVKTSTAAQRLRAKVRLPGTNSLSAPILLRT